MADAEPVATDGADAAPVVVKEAIDPLIVPLLFEATTRK
jgi:hypothetical protein